MVIETSVLSHLLVDYFAHKVTPGILDLIRKLYVLGRCSLVINGSVKINKITLLHIQKALRNQQFIRLSK